ncbi:MAG: hypothetical protein AAF654_11790 [Myxococcota bacterium]
MAALLRIWMVLMLTGCAGGMGFPSPSFEPLPELGPAPSGAIVTEHAVTLRFEDRGKAVAETVERIALRIVDAQAGARYQRLTFSDGRRGRVSSLAARRSDAKGSIEMVSWNGEGPASVGFRELNLDDRVDWRVVYTSEDPESAPPLVALRPEPVLKSTLRVEVRDGFEVEVRSGRGVEAGERRMLSGGEWEKAFERLPATPQDRLAPHPQRLGPWLLAVAKTGVSDNRAIDYASSWGRVAERLRERAQGTASVPVAQQQALGRGDGKRRLNAVREMFRVDSSAPLFGRPARTFSELRGSVTPFEAAKVMEGASVKAFERTRVALVASASGPLVFDDVPGLYGFTTAAVALAVGDRWTFAVPGCVACAFGRVPVEHAGARAFVADLKTPVLLSIPRGAVDTSSVRGQVSWKVSGDGRMTGSGLVELRGEAARQIFERSTALQSEATVVEALSEYWLGTDEIQIRGLSEPGILRPGEALPVTVELTSQGDAKEIRLWEIVGRSLPWFPTLDTPRALVLPAPLRDESIHTVQLRNSALAVTPGTESFSSDVGSLTVSYSQAGRLLTIRRVIEITELLIPESRFSELQALIKAARNADESRLTLIF